MSSLNIAMKPLFDKTKQAFARNLQRMKDNVLRKTDYLHFEVLWLDTFLLVPYGIDNCSLASLTFLNHLKSSDNYMYHLL